MKQYKTIRPVLAAGLVLGVLLATSGWVWAGEAPEASRSPLGASVPISFGSAAPTDWSTFYYVFAAGSTLRPRDSATGWIYDGSGCISATGSNLFTLHLDLPQGSRVEYLRLFYYDTSSGYSQAAWLTVYDGSGAFFEDLTCVTSAGDGGYGTTLSPFIGHIVDNRSYSYVLNWGPNVTGSTMQLCGLRVAYRLRTSWEVFLPIVFRDY